MIKFIITFVLMFNAVDSYAYWSCAWPYRTEINIQENTGSSLTDYQIKVTITGSNLNNAYDWTANGFDLRIVDSDDETLMDFWVEEWDQAGETATLWIKFNTLTSNINRNIYVYYGNEFADQLANVPFTFVESGIKFHTRQVTENPSSLIEAQNLFDGSDDTNSNYGCTFITDFTGIQNSIEFGSNVDFIAYSETYFEVKADETGDWGIRYGGDFGGGGGLYVNDTALEEQWGDDLWWGNNWTNASEVLEGVVELTEGYHKLEIIGQEGGNDGGITVQFQRPGDSFMAYDVADIEIVSRACPIAIEPTVTFGAHATATCPTPLAQYRLDEGGWGGTGDVIDQTGNFPGSILGTFSENSGEQVCNSTQVTANNDENTVSAIQTGVDLDDDIGAVGSIAFWVKLNNDWNDGLERKLIDASLLPTGSASEKYFYLDKRSDGGLEFRFEDSSDADFNLQEPAGANRLADVWYHITLTFDYPNDYFQLYVADTPVIEQSINTNGSVTDLNTIQIGDKIPSPNLGGSDRSADGSFDEITLYSSVISPSEIRGLMAITRNCAISNTKACEDVFPDGLVAINGGNIDFGFDAQLLNNPNTQLSAATISMNGAPNQYTCGATDVCTTGDPVVPFVTAGPFQTRVSTLDVNVGFMATETVGITSNEYRTINTSFRSTLNFSDSTYTEFFIDTLSIGSRNTVNLAPGTYWINNLSVGNRSTLNVLSDGPVRLYINNVSLLSSRVTINSPSEGVAGTPENLLIYFYDTTVSLGSRTTITGSVYAEGDVTFSSDVNIFGLLAANNINLGSSNQVTYLESSYDGLADLAWCASSSPSIGSITISAALTGINCLSSELDISIFDTNGDPLLDYDQTLNLSTDVMHADWSVDGTAQNLINNGSADDGAATYPMSPDDLGGIKLFLKNTHPEITTITVEAEGVSQTAIIDFQSAGFVFSNILTQISAQTSASLSIQAVETDQVTGACQALLLNNQTVEMAVECISPNSCGVASNQVNSTPVSTNGSGTVNSFSDVTLDFGDASSSIASFTNTYNDAGSLRLWARYQLLDSSGAATGNVIQGSSNAFINRPAGFCIESPDVNWQCSAPALNAGCTAFKQAGDTFNLSVTAKRYSSGSTDYCSHNTTANFTNVVNLSHNLIAPTAIDGGQVGSFSLSSINLNSGVGTSPIASFDDMGVFTITAGGNTYLTLATLDTNDSVNIGRFYPKEFNVISTTDATYDDGNTGFTYTGQLQADGLTGSISYVTEPNFTFEVWGFSDQSLHNYLAPLNSTPAAIVSASTNALDGTSPVPIPMTVTSGFSAGIVVGPDASDQFTYTFDAADHFRFDRSQTSLRAPFTNDIQLTVASFIEPVDGINLSAPSSISGTGGLIYYGRIRIENAYGPETRPVPQVFKAEYFDGTQFIFNTLDSGSDYDLTDINTITVTDVGSADNLAVGNSTISGQVADDGQFSNGLFNTSWSVPTNNRYGTYSFLYAVESWLQYDWNASADGVNEDPAGIVNFGQYRGNDRVIYWKEINY
jgi:MSHA biogenesis protein MshQ